MSPGSRDEGPRQGRGPGDDDRIADWVDARIARARSAGDGPAAPNDVWMDAAEREAFEAELGVSADLRDEVERHQAFVEALRAALDEPSLRDDVPPDPERTARILETTRGEPQETRGRVLGGGVWRTRIAAAAAAVAAGLALTMLFVWSEGLRPRSLDTASASAPPSVEADAEAGRGASSDDGLARRSGEPAADPEAFEKAMRQQLSTAEEPKGGYAPDGAAGDEAGRQAGGRGSGGAGSVDDFRGSGSISGSGSAMRRETARTRTSAGQAAAPARSRDEDLEEPKRRLGGRAGALPGAARAAEDRVADARVLLVTLPLAPRVRTGARAGGLPAGPATPGAAARPTTGAPAGGPPGVPSPSTRSPEATAKSTPSSGAEEAESGAAKGDTGPASGADRSTADQAARAARLEPRFLGRIDLGLPGGEALEAVRIAGSPGQVALWRRALRDRVAALGGRIEPLGVSPNAVRIQARSDGADAADVGAGPVMQQLQLDSDAARLRAFAEVARGLEVDTVPELRTITAAEPEAAGEQSPPGPQELVVLFRVEARPPEDRGADGADRSGPPPPTDKKE